MAKITLDIEEKNLKTVLNILDNLKEGLIKNISSNKQYQTSSSNDKTIKKPTSNSKYLSREEFKKRIKGN